MLNLGSKIGAALTVSVLRMKNALKNDDAMATLEAVLLITVFVALVLMFKDTIIDFVNGILDNISSQSSVFDPASMAP